MRDLLVTLIVIASLPMIFKRPYIGAVMWVWISVMNPHTQGWGFARTFPFAAIIAATTIVSVFLTKEDKRLPVTPIVKAFIVFFLWMCVTALFAIHPDQIGEQWSKVTKISLMTLVVLTVLKKRWHIESMIWSIIVSIGYYGVKGGIFTLRSGGADRVWGPEGTFINGNNEVALAFVMVVPLMYYMATLTKQKYARYALYASMALCALSALGSYSRGALLAVAAMGAFLWIKSKEKVAVGLGLLLAVPPMLFLMPSKWFERMDTIKTYSDDESAMGRINAWKMAANLANDRLFGGSFQIYDAGVFQMYAPVPADVHAAHSIYFQVLGEHGWIGLFLYLLLGVLTWKSATWIAKNTVQDPDMAWAHNLAMMMQSSLIGFIVGGAFLSLAYFDVPYYLMVAIVATRIIVEKELKDKMPAKRALAKQAERACEPRPSSTQPAGVSHADH
jgi:putative inorganic carbon (HCO3(-)) transporter